MAARDTVLEWLSSEPGKMALAGVLGGIVRWVTLRESWRDGGISLIVGGICALYLGPLVSPLMEPFIGRIAPDGDPVGFSSFLVGISGTSIAATIIGIFEARRKQTQEVNKDGD